MKERGDRKKLVGTVVSDRMDKTVVVQIERLVKHPIYMKYVRRRAKYAAHDNDNACRVGDLVQITESRPLSRTKRWRVSQIIEKAV